LGDSEAKNEAKEMMGLFVPSAEIKEEINA
jgi:hypothetical protein